MVVLLIKTGCNFVFTFDNIKKIANGKPLTKELVLEIINSLNLLKKDATVSKNLQKREPKLLKRDSARKQLKHIL